jgi:hypothetical protein
VLEIRILYGFPKFESRPDFFDGLLIWNDLVTSPWWIFQLVCFSQALGTVPLLLLLFYDHGVLVQIFFPDLDFQISLCESFLSWIRARSSVFPIQIQCWFSCFPNLDRKLSCGSWFFCVPNPDFIVTEINSGNFDWCWFCFSLSSRFLVKHRKYFQHQFLLQCNNYFWYRLSQTCWRLWATTINIVVYEIDFFLFIIPVHDTHGRNVLNSGERVVL